MRPACRSARPRSRSQPMSCSACCSPSGSAIMPRRWRLLSLLGMDPRLAFPIMAAAAGFSGAAAAARCMNLMKLDLRLAIGLAAGRDTGGPGGGLHRQGNAGDDAALAGGCGRHLCRDHLAVERNAQGPDGPRRRGGSGSHAVSGGCCNAAIAVGRAKLLSGHRYEYPQRRDHRARRPWQDDARRPAVPPVGHLPRQPARRRARDGFQRPRERARDHHPCQMHLGRMERCQRQHHAHQHRRHARPRRFRRRGRAHPQHGRRRHPAGRRGRGPDAADQVRHRQGAEPGPSPDRRGQQDRPPGRAARRSARRMFRAVPQPRGQ